MKHTEHCDQAGCQFSFTHPNQAVARRVLGNHKRRQHGIVGKSPSAQWKARTSQTEPVGNSQPEEPKPKKVMEYMVNLCPNCGCPIRAVGVAINLGGRR